MSSFAKITNRTLFAIVISILVLVFSSTTTHGATADSFITTWKTDNVGSSNDDQAAIRIATAAGGYNATIEWGDGCIDQAVSAGSPALSGEIVHTYDGSCTTVFNSTGLGVMSFTPSGSATTTGANTYTIAIDGAFPRIQMGGGGDRAKLLSVEQWGNIAWEAMNGAFQDLPNFEINALDGPNLSGATQLNDMFDGTTFVTQPDLTMWDTSTIQFMARMFKQSNFNGDISTWDVSNVENFFQFMQNGFNFSGDVSGWDISGATNLRSMFQNQPNFNSDISGWVLNNDLAITIGARQMFNGASSFNADISGWDTSRIGSMDRFLSGATSFTHSLADWDVGNVSNLNNALNNTALSIASYDATIIGWEAQLANVNTGLNWGVAGLQYCSAEAQRTSLDTIWDFNGDSRNCMNIDITSTLVPITLANQTAYPISGTCGEDNDLITIVVDGVDVTPTPTPICAGGVFGATVDLSSIPSGNNLSILVTVSDDAGVLEAQSDTDTIDRPLSATLATPVALITPTNQASYPVEGTCDQPGDLLVIVIAGVDVTPPPAPTCPGSGVFNIPVDTTSIPGGSHTIEVMIIDEAGRGTSASVIDNIEKDTDNVSTSEEDNGPNGGDANGDGIKDSAQSSVASYINPHVGGYVATVVSGDCSAITRVDSFIEPDFTVQDTDFDYVIGLHGVELTCGAVGDSATITHYWDQEYDTSQWNYRKLINNTYVDFNDQVAYGTTDVAGTTVTTVTFGLTDGGLFDADGVVNGKISDPAGPAIVESEEVLAETGQNIAASISIGLGIAAVAGLIRRKEQPPATRKIEIRFL